jgi:hypothetical protein
MKKTFVLVILIGSAFLFSQNRLERNLVGHWTFDDIGNLTDSTVGNDLVLEGSHVAVQGPEAGDGAVTIGAGSYYDCAHDIPANGGSASWVNDFTIVVDVKIPQSNQWYCFYQTNYSNINDGDWFINSSGQVGVGDTGYSNETITPNEWYRLAISVNLGGHYDYYLDGQLLHNGGTQSLDGRFALYPVDNGNSVLFFADNNGEDNAFDIANLMLYDIDLSAVEIADLGGYGHEIESPEELYMTSYLQTPTPTSIYISWHENNSTESVVEYGLSEDLGLVQTGSHYEFFDSRIWHTVQLSGLSSNTKYYYKCVSDTASSEVRSFRTQPDSGSGHIRFAVYGDNRTDIAMHTEIVHALKETVEEDYNEELEDYLNVVLNVGDIVTYGWTLSQYENEYFNPVSSVSKNVPFMISIGNHEAEADYFYDYMKYEDIQGDEGEKYFSFQIESIIFISLNSNTQGDAQLNWLENELNVAEQNDDVSWIFAFLHHPGRSEIWPDGNTGWVQNYVIPMLAESEKTEGLFYGHSHNYERGLWDSGNLRLLLAGGGGSALDRWGMYANQEDYHEIQRAHDYYGYTIFDVDLDDNSYKADSYSLGHNDLPMDNVIFDSFSRYRNANPPETPAALSPVGISSDILVASPFTSEADICSSQFQLTEVPNEWSDCLLNEIKHWENVYGDSGAPNYIPIDLNEDIQLNRLSAENLQLGSTYWWRMRYRDQNLKWSDWSLPAEFTYDGVIESAEFTADITEGNTPLDVRFTDLSLDNVSVWDWDLDGDGQTDSYERDPVFNYSNSGVYSVSLTVTINDVLFTETKEDYISVYGTNADDELQITNYELSNFPNPFNPCTTISFNYSRKDTEDAKINIYNVKGRNVDSIPITSSDDSVVWNAEEFSSGIYFYKLNVAGKEVASKKMMLLK